jgi:methyl-accepting chemotaxis protein
MNFIKFFSIRYKLLLLVILPVIISTTVAVIISALRISEEGTNGLQEKSEAILSRMEAVRTFVAKQGMLDQTIKDMVKKNPDGKLSEQDKEIVLNQVPIVSSWKVGADNAEKDNYTFRIASSNPRNSENLANAKEKRFLQEFEKSGDPNKTIVYEDEESNSLWVMRPIFLDETQGCLVCHGKPSDSPYGNGKDVLGVDMENWKDGEFRGMFMIKSDLKPVHEKVNNAIFTIIIWGAVIALIAIFIGIVIVRKIVSIIHKIKGVSQKVAEGNLTDSLEVNSNDELGELSENINTMVDSLNSVLIEVRDTADTLSNATKEISSSSNQISEGAQNQAAQFEELSSSVQSTADSSDHANKIINNAVDHANVAGKGMTDSLQAMDEIKSSSGKIEEAIKIITDIAFQTNILALNAAVEAARAGEHGKGFAVVAAEVRKLAERSSVSAKEITEIIETSSEHVEKGAKISANAAEKIKLIVDGVNKTASELSAISMASQEQSDAMEKNTSITASNAAAAEELAASAQSLDDQAQVLRDLVDNFVLNENKHMLEQKF